MSTHYMLETLFQPADPKDAKVEIVLVDGFFGGKGEAWTQSWIQGLQTEMPHARIQKFGYREGLAQSDSSHIVYEQTRKHAAGLAASLDDRRPDRTRRPIIFITRGLSSLVCVQFALGDSSLDSTTPKESATRRTRGVFALEAPFRGSFTTELVDGSSRKMTVLADPISLQELREGSDGFRRVMTALKKMVTRDREDLDRPERVIQNFENRIVNQADAIHIRDQNITL